MVTIKIIVIGYCQRMIRVKMEKRWRHYFGVVFKNLTVWEIWNKIVEEELCHICLYNFFIFLILWLLKFSFVACLTLEFPEVIDM